MATTLGDAVVRLRLDLEGAKKDAAKIREERGAAIGKDEPAAPAAPVDTKPAGSEPSPGRRGPGGGSSGRRTPGLGPSQERIGTQVRVKKTEKAVDKLRARGIISGVSKALGAIPVAGPVFGGIVAGAALTERFGPGILSGVAGEFAKVRAGGGEAGEVARAGIVASIKPLELQFEVLSKTVAEITSFLSSIVQTRGQLGAEAITRGLVSDDPDFSDIADVGAAFFKVNRAVARARKRGEFLERRAFNEGLGGAIGNMLGEAMSK